MRRTETAGLFTLERHRIDSHDVQRARDAGTLNRIHADATGSDHYHGIPGTHLTGAHRRPVPGRHTTPDQRRLVQRCPLVDFDQRRLGDHGVFRERAQQAHLADVLTAGMETVSPVDLGSHHERRTQVAHVAHPPRAIGTVPTRRQERQDHRIALGDVLDTRTHFDHGAGTLVATDDGQRNGQITGHEVLI